MSRGDGAGASSEEYVAKTDSGYYVAGKRVSLDSIVYAFLAGQTAEAIAQAFPLLTLEQVYGALTFYLAHRQDVDAYLSAQREDFEVKRAAAVAADPMFYQKLAARRRSRRHGYSGGGDPRRACQKATTCTWRRRGAMR